MQNNVTATAQESGDLPPTPAPGNLERGLLLPPDADCAQGAEPEEGVGGGKGDESNSTPIFPGAYKPAGEISQAQKVTVK